jgi:hypothetical protein
MQCSELLRQRSLLARPPCLIVVQIDCRWRPSDRECVVTVCAHTHGFVNVQRWDFRFKRAALLTEKLPAVATVVPALLEREFGGAPHAVRRGAVTNPVLCDLPTRVWDAPAVHTPALVSNVSVVWCVRACECACECVSE